MSWFKPFWKKLTPPSSGEGKPAAVPVDSWWTWAAQKLTESQQEQLPNLFTPRAKRVLCLARSEADRLKNDFVGTEHVLLGLIGLGSGVAVNVLRKLGLNLDNTRAEVEKRLGNQPNRNLPSRIPYTPRVKKVLALAAKEAQALNHTYVGTEHILLGLLREGDGPAAQILKNFKVDLDQTIKVIREEIEPEFL
jgi:ATP-dependent Clp protease ATP-binding subunit ClpC